MFLNDHQTIVLLQNKAYAQTLAQGRMYIPTTKLSFHTHPPRCFLSKVRNRSMDTLRLMRYCLRFRRNVLIREDKKEEKLDAPKSDASCRSSRKLSGYTSFGGD